MVGYTCIDAEEIEMGVFLGLTGQSTYPRWATRNSKEKKKVGLSEVEHYPSTLRAEAGESQ